MLLNRCQYLLPFLTESTLPYKPLVTVRYAARKGTRERREKKKVKVVKEKVAFIPHNQRDKEKLLKNRPKLKFDDSAKPTPIDNVYIMRKYKMITYPFVEALQCHRETHHPDMYNKPNADVQIKIELNMVAERKTRLLDNFTRMAPMPHKINHGEERSILAFVKEAELQEAARKAGASLAGGVELIKEIQSGSLSLQNFHFIVAHPSILPELVSIRGLLKKKFPNPKNGTLNANLHDSVTKFMNGITYSAIKDEYEKDFGLIETVIGTLGMDDAHLEENFASLLLDVYEMKPKRSGTFISRCLMISPPSREKFKVDHSVYLPVEQVEVAQPEEEEEEPVAEAAAS
ncbi:hypothetical protein PPYR_03866 [Photinus pyralis]|uniref:39S ribosomal protein L1, mitochondrial n=1 Tax=Photinus pyralis TaxID=7054 RepID=A0A5N4AWR8_PHOPY|nr:uncharacterized protein LOC116163748 [Photinus pyralis]XP_031337943.1 uncharacterized protein LOC116166890 [Photinus pyralis]KAB0800271.1 hypothetical protein PPYR_06011 [Photinus pyralis]KAB0801680.1 hypothetical protein PPYR_03866 [Photinus pyralis]